MSITLSRLGAGAGGGAGAGAGEPVDKEVPLRCLGSRRRLTRDLEERRLGWVERSRLTRNRAWVEVQVEVQVEAYEV